MWDPGTEWKEYTLAMSDLQRALHDCLALMFKSPVTFSKEETAKLQCRSLSHRFLLQSKDDNP